MRLTVTAAVEIESAIGTSSVSPQDQLILAAILASGPPGPPGPVGSIGDTEFPDFTLLFENQLV